MPDVLSESLNRDTDAYLFSLLPPPDPVLRKMQELALERGFPFIGPLVGVLLGQLAQAIGARRVFEMGSGFGYSAIHFARAIPDGGRVICTDGDEANEKIAKAYFMEAGVSQKVDFLVGDAVYLMRQQTGFFDIVLMDIDKEGYPDGFRAAWPMIRPGGLLIVDNMLWHGRVMTGDERASTRGVRALTRLLYSTPDAKTSILPLRDGVAVVLKLV